jgi:hypothetical protein
LAAHAAAIAKGDAAAYAPLDREPPDLAALYAVADGLELADGTRILRREEILPATAWLCSERALEWGPDLWVIGERDDLVIVRDTDALGARGGGGVLEVPTDELSRLSREALDVMGYLEDRLGLPAGGDRAPERAAREAVVRRDAAAIEHAIARPFYPGSARDLAHAALTLGVLRAEAGDAEASMDAFARAVEARVRAAPRGAEQTEARAGWRACAVAAEKAGASAVAELCQRRGRA